MHHFHRRKKKALRVAPSNFTEQYKTALSHQYYLYFISIYTSISILTTYLNKIALQNNTHNAQRIRNYLVKLSTVVTVSCAKYAPEKFQEK